MPNPDEAALGAATETLAFKVLSEAAVALAQKRAMRAAEIAQARKRSYRVVRYDEMRAEIIERVGFKIWRSLVRVIEEKFEAHSKRPDVQKRAWLFVAYLLRQHGHPNLWGRPFPLTRYSEALAKRFGWGTGMIRTLIEWLTEIGLLQMVSKPLVRRRDSDEYECYTYVLGEQLRAAQQKLFKGVYLRTKSPVYRGVFLLSIKKSLEHFLKRKKIGPLLTGDLTRPAERRVSDADVAAMFGKATKPPKFTPAPKLDQIADSRLAGALAGLGTRVAGRGQNRPVEPSERPQPGFVPLTPMPSMIVEVVSLGTVPLNYEEDGAARYPVTTRAQREPKPKRLVPTYAKWRR